MHVDFKCLNMNTNQSRLDNESKRNFGGDNIFMEDSFFYFQRKLDDFVFYYVKWWFELSPFVDGFARASLLRV